jgi:hypothetical protein
MTSSDMLIDCLRETSSGAIYSNVVFFSTIVLFKLEYGRNKLYLVAQLVQQTPKLSACRDCSRKGNKDQDVYS